MEYFALLTTSTLVIAALGFALFRKRRDFGIVAGIAALYYWSLFGAWYVVLDKTGGYSGKGYQYLEQKMFPVALDGDYLLTLALYSAFIVLVELTMLIMLKRRSPAPIPRLTLRHGPILLIAFLAAAGSIYLIEDKLATAWALNASAYVFTRTETDRWFTLHQTLNRIALIPPAIGFAIYLAGRESRHFVNVVRRYTLPAYLALFGLMCAFTFVLGNKNEVFYALVVGFLAYMGTAPRARLWKTAGVVAIGMLFLTAIDSFRGIAFSELINQVEQHFDEATDVGHFLTTSNEAYGAHFSMYGVLASDTQPVYGYSLYSLVCSVIPRALWRDRPDDIYIYYVERVGAVQDQGYSIHHATGWYLNFGYWGVALGAIVMGLAWGYCIDAHRRVRASSGMLFRLFAAIAPWVFVACIPPLVRAGPEGYKGLMIDGILIPMSALAFACRPRKEKLRLRWSASAGWAMAR